MYSKTSSISTCTFYYNYIELIILSFKTLTISFVKKISYRKLLWFAFHHCVCHAKNKHKLINCNCMFVREKSVIVSHVNYKECSVCGDHIRHGVRL